MTAEATAPQPNPASPALRQPRRLSEVTLQVLIMTALLAVLLGVLRWTNTRAFEAYNVQTLSRDVAILSLLALGQAVVLIAGGIDLSVGSIVCFVGMNAILFLAPPDSQQRAWSAALVLPAALAFATAVGVGHGLLVCLMRLPPFMVTLCSLLVFRSVARGITNDTTVAYRDELLPTFSWLGNGMLNIRTISISTISKLADGPFHLTTIGVPIPVLVALGVLGLLAFFMHLTVHGRYLY